MSFFVERRRFLISVQVRCLMDRDNISPPQLLTLAEFSERSRVSTATLHRWIKAGKIPCYQPGGKHGRLFFPINAIEVATTPTATAPAAAAPSQKARLSGPAPKWKRPRTTS